MSRKVDTQSPKTHGGADAVWLNPEQMLRRSVLSCMLFESEFYEAGHSIADRIVELVPEVEPAKVATLAIEAREKFKLRRVPLLIVSAMMKSPLHKKYVSPTLERIIQRADQMSDFLSLYGKRPLAHQVKKGLAKAFTKFDEYQLSKYKEKGDKYSLRDVMFLVHPKPLNEVQAAMWKKLANKELEPPKTWETELSAGKNKKDVFESLIKERKLGAMALLRNLRGMKGAGVSDKLIADALQHMKVERVLPFRFITANRHAPDLREQLEKAMFKCVESGPKMIGKTIVAVDVSGSMSCGIGGKSELSRLEAAFALAILIKEMSVDCNVYATAGSDSTIIHKTAKCKNVRGFKLADDLRKFYSALGGGGIFLTQLMNHLHIEEKYADRVIVITDEQDCDSKLRPDMADAFGTTNYLINIASYKNGIGYGKWQHIDGFSEASVNWILEYERELSNQFKIEDIIFNLE